MDFWKTLWKVLIPNSAKVHVWRVCNNILPSLERLASKHVNVESQTCVLCEVEMETTLHLCRNCSYTNQVLYANPYLTRTCYDPQTDHLNVLDWLRFCAKELSIKELGDLMYLLWGIWKERNCRVWEAKRTPACDVLIRSMSRLHDYRFHNSKLRSEATRCLRVEKWKPPSIGTLKVNIDGSFYESTRQGGFGFVIRDSDGQFIVGGGGPLSQLLSPEHAELSAFQAALDYIMEHDMQQVVVETDSTKVQRQLTTAAMPNTSTLGRVYDDLLMLLESQPNVTIVHARRDANKVAHLLASQASSFSQVCFYSFPPQFLLAAVAADLCSM
ncbi:uncharacterized protein LOC112171284 [Rosa chinensis]|uniref:uncharacterized protein LOC112171284 n=1 Tax=Rosa chinensis TaxID=74649 RepID=UPI000D09287E|nr:uncharacterized protein LOC112171284 [Rosa chinensis]